ncbi:MAG: hypothetical protein HOU81_21240 [Hamadaea sp.]|uniref:hypothetical protein n=1 Tax=Hamadaea sp. TaxID=2024425 RepID=UPI0017AF1BB7|nr:hypothetical protein [Hamadaea sp.]NUR73351.1 hypothetical protein [Hamadaea sp.]NUT21281.1 hypothetical protein [Hamadaea sp.]
MATLTTPTEEIKAILSPARRAATGSAGWLRDHWVSLALMVPVLALTAFVHLKGSANFPRYTDDPGTYLSQAWSVVYEHRLSPYSYFYDHAPGGWLQIAAWAAPTRGFDRYDSALAFGTECMLLAKLASTGLLYLLARRIGLSRAGGVAAAALFGLTPLGVVYGRWVFLDNLVTPWLIGAFALAYAPKRSIGAATGASAAFAMAVVTKETTLILLPAFVWAMAQNLDRRNRTQVVTVSAFTGMILLLLYPLYALYKGELFAGQGHTSLLGTAAWQLSGREGSGTIADAGSAARHLLESWLVLDRLVLLGGLVALPFALCVRRLRPVALALLLGWFVLLRGGYVPAMHVIVLLPFSALLIPAALEAIAGTPALVERGVFRVRPLGIWGIDGRRRVAAVLGAALLAFAAVTWTPSIRDMIGPNPTPPLRSALNWTVEHVPPGKVLVVHDSLWVDLVQKHHYEPRPIIAHKLDSDPSVKTAVDRIDYLIVPNWYYRSELGDIPTLGAARQHATVVASFGSGDDGVRVYRVDPKWRPAGL